MKRTLFWLIVGLAGATLAGLLFMTKDTDKIMRLMDDDYRNW